MAVPLPSPTSRPRDPAALVAALSPELRRTMRRPRELGRGGELLATGRSDIDTLLGGGLPRGALTELRGHAGGGRFAFVLGALATVTMGGENVALVDLGDGFAPREAAATGIVLERLLWIRPRDLRETLAAAEIAILGGFPLVAVDLGLPPIERGGRVDTAAWLRLARVAERERTALLVVTPWPLDGGVAAVALAFEQRRGHWRGRALPLLAGVDAEVRIARQRGRPEGLHAAIRWAHPEIDGLAPEPARGPAALAPTTIASEPRPAPLRHRDHTVLASPAHTLSAPPLR